MEPQRDVTAPQRRSVVSGPGSWANPRVRADGVKTRATSVHLPIDLAVQLDALRLRTHRRLSDILVEATREWLARRSP